MRLNLNMRLNSLKPAAGSKPSKKRVGRGMGSGLGKTAGRGHKGQKSRSGGYTKVGFEGGQMPIQRRLPKIGFNSMLAAATAEIRLHELNDVDSEAIDLNALKKAKVVGKNIKYTKIIASGELKKKVIIKGIRVTKGARAVIESAGGKVEE